MALKKTSKTLPVTPGRQHRLEAVRALLLGGIAPHRVVELLTQGLKLSDGRQVKVSLAVARKDLRSLGQAWQSFHDDPAVVEIYAGAALERLTAIAIAAMARTKTLIVPVRNAHGTYTDTVRTVPDPAFFAAIQANRAILHLMGIRSPRWRRTDIAEERLGLGLGEAGDELSGLSDDELREELGRRRGRVGSLRLLGSDDHVIDASADPGEERGTG